VPEFKWRLSAESRYAEGGLVAPTRRVVAQRRRAGTLFLNSFWDGRLGQLAFEFQIYECPNKNSFSFHGLAGYFTTNFGRRVLAKV
jgi:hypothetical protein